MTAVADERAEFEELRYNPYHGKDGRFIIGKKSSRRTKNPLTKKSSGGKMDSNGKPFRFPEAKLSAKEHKNVTDEIGRWWHSRYKGRELCWLKFTDKTYYFENRGIGDYNIYGVEKDD